MNGSLIVCTFLLRRLDDYDIGEDLIPKGKDYYYLLLLIKSIKTRDKLLTKASHPFDHTFCPIIVNKHVLHMLRCMKCFQVVCTTKTLFKHYLSYMP